MSPPHPRQGPTSPRAHLLGTRTRRASWDTATTRVMDLSVPLYLRRDVMMLDRALVKRDQA